MYTAKMLGIGTDILFIARFRKLMSSLDADDPFVKKTYSQKELEQASKRSDPVLYFASRFSGKEAVFKSLGLGHDQGSFSQIEILNDFDGRPYVNLCGEIKTLAGEKGVSEVLISLSNDTDYAIAFATAQR